MRGLAERSASRSFEDDPTHHPIVTKSPHTIRSSNRHYSPPDSAAPNKVAAFSRSAEISRSLSRRAFSRGSRTASSSYSSSSSSSSAPRAARDALAASFSANLALRVPFFFGGATGAGAGLPSSSSSSEDSSQSLCACDGVCQWCLDRWRWSSRVTYGGFGFLLVFALPFVLDGLGWDCNGGACGGVIRVFCARGGGELCGRGGERKCTPVGHVCVERTVAKACDLNQIILNRGTTSFFGLFLDDHYHKASPNPSIDGTELITHTNSARLLQLAVPLVKTHGFTRAALARAVLDLPQPHMEPLSDGAVTALFGRGDDARRTLINAWLEDARCRMKRDNHHVDAGTSTGAWTPTLNVRDVLYARLRTNEPVLEHLPEVRPPLSSPWYPTRPSSNDLTTHHG